MLLLIILVEHVMTQAVEKHVNVTGVQLQDKHTSQMSELRRSAIP